MPCLQSPAKYIMYMYVCMMYVSYTFVCSWWRVPQSSLSAPGRLLLFLLQATPTTSSKRLAQFCPLQNKLCAFCITGSVRYCCVPVCVHVRIYVVHLYQDTIIVVTVSAVDMILLHVSFKYLQFFLCQVLMLMKTWKVDLPSPWISKVHAY